MIRVLLLVLLLAGCGSESESEIEELPVDTFSIVEKSIKVSYIDSNCLEPVAPLDKILNGYVVYDDTLLYSSSGDHYRTNEYYKKINDGCYRTITEFVDWVTLDSYPMPDIYKVIDDVLYIMD